MGLEIGRSEMITESNAGENKGVELSVLVPAFNEEQGIAVFLELLFGVLRSCCTRFEVWVIDDGSRDGTWKQLAAGRIRYPELRGLRFTRNFGKEAAMLAGLPKAPSSFNPVSNPQRAKLRQQYVLRRMRELNYISDAQWRLADQQPLTVKKDVNDFAVKADHLAEMVRQVLYERFRDD
ncbi:MAG: glycosyltransferase, partial [Deltaproteobacteria bacterium]|nr:glycosyltransferase [Deltaproteobacteria bacterium]